MKPPKPSFKMKMPYRKPKILIYTKPELGKPSPTPLNTPPKHSGLIERIIKENKPVLDMLSGHTGAYAVAQEVMREQTELEFEYWKAKKRLMI